MGKPTYLQKRNGIYYVVRRVPASAKLSANNQYVKRSLHTSDYALAKVKLWEVLAQIEAQFIDGAEDDIDHRCYPPLLTSSLFETIEAWIDDRSVRWSQSMKDDDGFIMPVVVRIIGNKAVTDVSRADVRSMKPY